MTGAMIREIFDVIMPSSCRHHQGVDDSRRQDFPEACAGSRFQIAEKQ
jgi:hypothetical protein